MAKSQPSLRATRITAVHDALYAQRIAAKHAKFQAATEAAVAAADALAKKEAYHAAVAQLQAQYGVVNTRTIHTIRTNAASAGSINFNGTDYSPTKAVHAIAAHCNGNRKATLAMCAEYGINPATAATQYSIYRKALDANTSTTH